MKKVYGFIRFCKHLWRNYFLASTSCDEFPVIEMGQYGNEHGAYSLVYLKKGVFPQHIHDKSHAKFYFVSGKGFVTVGSNEEKVPFKKNYFVNVPAGTAHGFIVEEEGCFMVWQSRPITDPITHKRDVHYVDPNCVTLDTEVQNW